LPSVGVGSSAAVGRVSGVAATVGGVVGCAVAGAADGAAGVGATAEEPQLLARSSQTQKTSQSRRGAWGRWVMSICLPS